MFAYLRYFYALSVVLVIISAIFIGIQIRSMTTDGLNSLIQNDDRALAQQYISSIWARFYPKATRGTQRYEQMAIFRKESKHFTKHSPKLRISLHGPNGEVILRSADRVILNDEKEEIDLFIKNYLNSKSPISRIVENVELLNQSEATSKTVVQTIVPIPNPSYNANSPLCRAGNSPNTRLANVCRASQGIIEIVTDVSSQWNELAQMQLLATGGMIGIFVLLISILFFTTIRAEAIIAKQHEANLELITTAATAEAENRDKSQFLANISHELRTPLNAIIGFSEIIKKEALGNLQQTHQEYIRDIHSSGKHLLSLINDILDYSKAEAGKLELDLAEVDLSKLIVNSMRLVITRAEEAQVTLVEDLPEEHIVCATDGKKLKQVILNLLSNAVKFTPAGGEVRVSAWQKLLDGKVCIQVKDTGIGIAPKDIAKVMSPFGQVESNLSRRYEGTGLGLPLSKKFVEIMGGEFQIESEVDKGTTITITLPGPSQNDMNLNSETETQPALSADTDTPQA